MKAVLEFKLPEESEEFRRACRAGVLESFIEEFETILRSKDKYSSEPTTTWADVRTLWYDLKLEADIE